MDLLLLANCTCALSGTLLWPGTCTCVPCPGGFECTAGIPTPCPPDTWSQDGLCRPCSKCDNETFIARLCSATRDTACRRCMEGWTHANSTCHPPPYTAGLSKSYEVALFLTAMIEVLLCAWAFRWHQAEPKYRAVPRAQA